MQSHEIIQCINKGAWMIYTCYKLINSILSKLSMKNNTSNVCIFPPPVACRLCFDLVKCLFIQGQMYSATRMSLHWRHITNHCCWWGLRGQFCDVNPLTTNEDYRRHWNLDTCYQLVQSVLKIGCALAERVGQGEEVGDTQQVTVHGGCCSWLYNSPGLCRVGHFSAFLHKQA